MPTPTRLYQRGRLHHRLLRESIIALLLLGVGLVALPLAVFYVGTAFFGAYEGGTGGAGSFLDAIFSALAGGDRGAWLLVLSPFVVITLLRMAKGALTSRSRQASRSDSPDTAPAAAEPPRET